MELHADWNSAVHPAGWDSGGGVAVGAAYGRGRRKAFRPWRGRTMATVNPLGVDGVFAAFCP
jgi:hypothetical protein